MTASSSLNSAASLSIPHHETETLRQLRVVLRIVAILWGFFAFWAARQLMSPDGISYLDIADHYTQGTWRLAVSEYWSPVFSWCLAAALSLFRPAPQVEATLVHGVSFVGYCFALITFEYFFRQLTTVLAVLDPESAKQLRLRQLLLIAAYAAFIVGTIGPLGSTTPDLLVTVLVYLVSGMMLRCSLEDVGLPFCACLGAVLGICWLTKSALLLPGLMALASWAIQGWQRRRPLVHVICALLALSAVCFPYLAAIRIAKGHWTLGRTGLLNYSWEVDEVPRYFHWQGGPKGYGKPLHPTRQMMASPPVYEFSTNWGVTYAPWFDPPYWYEGLRVKFDAGRQIRAFGVNFSTAMVLLLMSPGAFVGLLIWCFKRGNGRAVLMWWKMTGCAWVWCGATVLLYSAVCVEPRYISGTLAVMSCLLLAPALSSPVPILVRRTGYLIAASIFPCVQALWRPAVFGAAFLLVELTGLEPNGNAYWQEAQYLQHIGVRPGDAIGVIGEGAGAYWARLLHAHVIAEIPAPDTRKSGLVRAFHPDPTGIIAFWRASRERQQEVLSVFSRAGAQWLVAEPVPLWVKPGNEWIEVPFTRKGEEEFGFVTRTFVRRLAPGAAIYPTLPHSQNAQKRADAVGLSVN